MVPLGCIRIAQAVVEGDVLKINYELGIFNKQEQLLDHLIK